MRNITYSEGAKHVADTVGSHWLLDIIATNQLEPKVKQEAFQVWKLTVVGSKAKVVCDDGNGNIVFEQIVDYTDFPEPGIDLYFTDDMIFLPSEY